MHQPTPFRPPHIMFLYINKRWYLQRLHKYYALMAPTMLIGPYNCFFDPYIPNHHSPQNWPQIIVSKTNYFRIEFVGFFEHPTIRIWYWPLYELFKIYQPSTWQCEWETSTYVKYNGRARSLKTNLNPIVCIRLPTNLWTFEAWIFYFMFAPNVIVWEPL